MSDTRLRRAWFGYGLDMPADSALVRMLRAGRPEAANLENALDSLAMVFGRPSTAERLGAHVTCDEANRIAWVLIESRHVDAAVVWVEGHAASDTEDDVHGREDFDAVHYLTGQS
jgi:hypothetical protein